MKKEIKDLWVKALRSGEFKQCRGQLEQDEKYCALGVLAALALVEGHCSWNDGGRYDGKRYSLSAGIMLWAGIATNNKRYLTKNAGKVQCKYENGSNTIAGLNDEGMSFQKIANLIETCWQDL